MTNTVTLDLKRYEDLLLKEKAVNERKVIGIMSIYGTCYRYIIENETELSKSFEIQIKDNNDKYFLLKSELYEIKSKWWYKLFTKFSK